MWADIVRKNVKLTKNSVKSIQKLVKSAVDDNVISSNFIMYSE